MFPKGRFFTVLSLDPKAKKARKINRQVFIFKFLTEQLCLEISMSAFRAVSKLSPREIKKAENADPSLSKNLSHLSLSVKIVIKILA